MILAEKIVQLRKKNNWSQEELAEKLDVSRQSVSKWEGALAVPDLDKIIKLSEIFQVSTDYLLKDDISDDAATYTDSYNEEYIRNITLEEANKYINDKKKAARSIGLGVMCCILSPLLLILLYGISQVDKFGLSEELACGIGIPVLFILVVIAVSVFIATGFKLSKYDYIIREPFKLCYGVAPVIKEKKERYSSTLTIGIISGVSLCILSPIPVITAALLNAGDLVIMICVCTLLFIVCIAVFLFIVTGSPNECFNQLLQAEEYSTDNKEKAKKEESIGGIYWPIITIAYLLTSFLSGSWHLTWLIWPCAGLLFGMICTLLKINRN